MPGHYVKDAGVWKEITTTPPQAKVSGNWVPITEIHVKNAGAWVKVWPTALPPTPTNLRFQFKAWQNSRYEVQPLWDPVQSAQADGYHLEVTRAGGDASQADKVSVDTVRDNWWWDPYCGTTAGAVLTYRVRSYKGASVGDWSAPITTTTPAEAGFCKTTFIGPVGDYYGNIYTQIQHDGNPQNTSYDLYRQQLPYYDYTLIKSGGLTGAATNVPDAVGTDHYRGPSAGTANTGNCWANDIVWLFHLKNTWGKPNNQAGNPNPSDWGPFGHAASWKLSNPADRYIRLNAVSTNTYRQQPTNSLGWVGGVPRCGGNQGDMVTAYFYDKNNLVSKGFRNHIRIGQQIQWGLGRRNDGGQLNVTFNPCGFTFAYGFGGDPRSSYERFTAVTWQRLQGEGFILRNDWAAAFIDPGNQYGSLGMVSGNTAAQYAEFGYIGEIMGGWVNGQIVVYSPYG